MRKIYNKEKAAKVIELYLQNKTIRQIAEIVHMSFGDIGAIIKEYNDEQSHQNDLENSDVSEETKAMRLFFEGKAPIEVKIELNISTEKVETYYKNYWRLKRLNQLCRHYENEIKDNLPSFLELFKQVKKLGMSDKHIAEALRDKIQLPLITMVVNNKKSELKSLISKKGILISEIDDLNESKYKSQSLLDKQHTEIQRLSSEIYQKQTTLDNIKESIYTLISGRDYSNIKNIVVQTTTDILDNRQDILTASIVTAIQGIQFDPNKGFLINYLEDTFVDDFDYNFGNVNKLNCHLDLKKIQDYLISNHAPILELTNMLYERVLNIVQYNIFFEPKTSRPTRQADLSKKIGHFNSGPIG